MIFSSMWFDSIVTSKRKLKIAYNNSLKGILNLFKYNSASEMFEELSRKFVISFRSRFQDSSNTLANGIGKSSLILFSKIWTWWNDILNTKPL